MHKQLVLPHSLRESVLEVDNDSILGGHLATKKTYDRVTSNFFWPGAYDYVSRHCQSCDICQRTIPKGKCDKAPFVAMPIIGEPFTRVAIDLVGPLPISGLKHRLSPFHVATYTVEKVHSNNEVKVCEKIVLFVCPEQPS